MRVIKRKRLPGEPICRDCNYPLDLRSHSAVIIDGVSKVEAEEYSIANKNDCAWLTCKKCKTDYLVEGYYDWKKKLKGEDEITIDLSNLNIFRWFRKRNKKGKWQRRNK